MNTYPEIDVRDQARLPLSKVVRLVMSGITHRLLRSMLTMSVIMLAVAFFMTMLTENAVINAVAEGVEKEVMKDRASDTFLSHISVQQTPESIAEQLAKAESTDLEEYAAVTGWDLERLRMLAGQSEQRQRYLAFFSGLPMGKRRELIHNWTGHRIFQELQSSDVHVQFGQTIDSFIGVTVPGGRSGLFTFAEQYPEYRAQLKELNATWNAAVRELGSKSFAMANVESIDGLREWLAEADPHAYREWFDLVASHGFHVPQEKDVIQKDLQWLRRKEAVVNALKEPETAERWQKTFRATENLNEKIMALDRSGAVDVLGGQFTAEELVSVKDRMVYQRELAGLERSLTGLAGDDDAWLSPRQFFLLVISFVVCMVGIANAMLMAITERFREIATMKCLGATDRFILVQFMIEAGLQGVAGGAIGMVVGFVLALIKTTIGYGAYPYAYFPIGAVLLSLAISFVAGILLAVFASLYPSWSASRMAPMEAMRVE